MYRCAPILHFSSLIKKAQIFMPDIFDIGLTNPLSGTKTANSWTLRGFNFTMIMACIEESICSTSYCVILYRDLNYQDNLILFHPGKLAVKEPQWFCNPLIQLVIFSRYTTNLILWMPKIILVLKTIWTVSS